MWNKVVRFTILLLWFTSLYTEELGRSAQVKEHCDVVVAPQPPLFLTNMTLESLSSVCEEATCFRFVEGRDSELPRHLSLNGVCTVPLKSSPLRHKMHL